MFINASTTSVHCGMVPMYTNCLKEIGVLPAGCVDAAICTEDLDRYRGPGEDDWSYFSHTHTRM